jgi:hypothetical protein
MTVPRQRHKRRTHRWEGVVDEIEGDSLWAHIVPVDHKGPDLAIELAPARLPKAQLGTVFTIYIHVRGKKRRTVIRERRLRRWTQEEIDGIEARARELAFWLQEAAS